MSDFSLITDFEQYEVTEEYRKKQDEKFIKWIKIFVLSLLVVFFIELIIFKIIQPSLNNPKIIVKGNSNYSTEYLMSKLVSTQENNWFGFSVENIASNLSSISGIESVTVKKVFPDKVHVNIKERESVAMIFVNKENHTVPIQIDKNGVLFENINNEIVGDGSIPIISGIPVEHLSEGMRIPAKYRVLIDQITELHKSSKQYFLGISEICVVPKTYGNYELVLIPANSKVRVLISRFLSVEVLDCMLVVLDVVNSIEPNVTEIDLRYNSVSYKTSVSDSVGGEEID